jgi:hypothetical protein
VKRSMLASPWFWIGGALSLVIWTAVLIGVLS